MEVNVLASQLWVTKTPIMKEKRVKTFFWKEYHPFDTSNYSLYPTKVNIKGYTWYLIPFSHSIFNGQYFQDGVLQSLQDFCTGISYYCSSIDFLWNFLPGRHKIGRCWILHLPEHDFHGKRILWLNKINAPQWRSFQK